MAEMSREKVPLFEIEALGEGLSRNSYLLPISRPLLRQKTVFVFVLEIKT